MGLLLAPHKNEAARLYRGFLIFLFFVPTFSGILKIEGTYFGEILQVMYVGAFLFILGMPHLSKKVQKSALLYAIGISLIFLSIILFALMRDAGQVVKSDFFELYKPIFALVIFCVSYLITWDEDALEKLAGAYTAILCTLSAYSFFEALGGGVSDRVATLLYRGDKEILLGKATGSFSTTYFFAGFMIFGAVFAIAQFFYLKRYRYLLLSLMCSASVIFTQSRSGALAFAALFASVFCLYWAYTNFRHKIRFYTVTIVVVMVGIYIINSFVSLVDLFPYLVKGITYLFEKGVSESGDNSFSTRYQQILFALNSQDMIPLLGAGIGKGYARLMESYYALYLFRYGIIGIALSLFIFFLFFIFAFRSYKRLLEAKRYRAASLFLAMHLWMYSFPILSLSSVVQDQVKMAFFFYGSLGIMVSYLWTRRRNSYSMPLNAPLPYFAERG